MLLYTHHHLSVCRSVDIVDDLFAARMPQLLRLRQECRSSCVCGKNAAAPTMLKFVMEFPTY